MLICSLSHLTKPGMGDRVINCSIDWYLYCSFEMTVSRSKDPIDRPESPINYSITNNLYEEKK